jgi:hypothetical protein
MGMLLLPILLLALYFFIPGLALGAKGIFRAQDKLITFAAIVGLFVACHAAMYVLPHLLFASQSVNQFSLFVAVFATAILVSFCIG